MKIHMVPPGDIESYFDRLWPLCRSITGEGVRQTLSILSEIIPLSIEEVPSGTMAFDWEIPKEWIIRGAYLEHESGRKILDFQENNLHVLGYSQPVDLILDLEQLKPHLYSLPDLPEAIPYITSYYEPRWGFCLPHRVLENLEPGKYRACIDSSFVEGSMTLGHCLLPGDSEEEILISTYTCHPSMANNELSGPLLSSFLYQSLAARKNRAYTYRFIFAPETVGTIAYLNLHGEEMARKVCGGLVVTCMGNANPYFYYVCSKQGDSLIDRAVEHAISYSGVGLRRAEFNPVLCSDLRQFSSPGFNLPIGAIARTLFSYGEYYGAQEEELSREYHTSLDNKDQMDFRAMSQTIEIFSSICEAMEMNQTFERVNPYCEPQLSKRNLYPSLSERKFNSDWKWVEQICWLLNFCDGNTDLLTIARRSKFPIHQLHSVAQTLVDHELLRRKKGQAS
ncbi:DUF4910 domain-containing protein [bacterium]|nr:DUF4910 domain-containing protein [bacterium]